MADLKAKLPTFCVAKDRKGYQTVYFQVPARLRPEGWPPAINIGRTDQDDISEIIRRGEDNYQKLILKRAGISASIRKGSLADVILRYQKTEHWTSLRKTTKEGYKHYLGTIHKWSETSNFPHVDKYQPKHIAAFLAKWKGKPRTRKYYKALLSKLWNCAIEEGLTNQNIVKEIGLPKEKNKKSPFKMWEVEDIDRFVKTADDMGLFNVGTAVTIAFEGFRQTDIFAFQEPRDYQNGKFKFTTSKTGENVSVYAYPRTVTRLANRPIEQLILTVNDITKRPWTKNAFYNQFSRVCDKAGMKGFVFRKIRNSAAIYGLRFNLTDTEFRQRFGWSKDTVEQMRNHYTDIDQEVMDSAAAKVKAYFDGKNS